MLPPAAPIATASPAPILCYEPQRSLYVCMRANSVPPTGDRHARCIRTAHATTILTRGARRTCCGQRSSACARRAQVDMAARQQKHRPSARPKAPCYFSGMVDWSSGQTVERDHHRSAPAASAEFGRNAYRDRARPDQIGTQATTPCHPRSSPSSFPRTTARTR